MSCESGEVIDQFGKVINEFREVIVDRPRSSSCRHTAGLMVAEHVPAPERGPDGAADGHVQSDDRAAQADVLSADPEDQRPDAADCLVYAADLVAEAMSLVQLSFLYDRTPQRSTQLSFKKDTDTQ